MATRPFLHSIHVLQEIINIVSRCLSRLSSLLSSHLFCPIPFWLIVICSVSLRRRERLLHSATSLHRQVRVYMLSMTHPPTHDFAKPFIYPFGFSLDVSSETETDREPEKLHLTKLSQGISVRRSPSSYLPRLDEIAMRVGASLGGDEWLRRWW